MSFIRGGETITIKRRSATGIDDLGQPTYETATVVIKDALIAIGTTSEDIDPARDATDATVTLYLPAGTRVDAGDLFIVRGSKWQRDGEAQDWKSPFGTGFEAGVVVPLRRRRG